MTSNLIPLLLSVQIIDKLSKICMIVSSCLNIEEITLFQSLVNGAFDGKLNIKYTHVL